MLDGVTRTNRNARQSPDRSYGEKLISLFAKLLFTGRRYSLTELARSLGCSKQTVLRLIDDISLAYEVPISEELVGRRKYVRIERQKGDGESVPAVPGGRRSGSTEFMGRKVLLKKGLRINPI